uniref:Interleukin-6 n=1 Tax=Seriola dumerili TaxID=41447 RepID=A0A3B4TVI3_SERDU
MFLEFLPLSIHSVIHALPLWTDACLVSAVMLAALLLCGLGAPVEIEPTNSPAGETSGEEEGMPTAPLSGSQVWDLIINQLEGLIKEVSEEDGFQVTESSLVKYKISSLPAKCPSSNKEVCLRWVAEGLETYMVLLKHVEKEYPNSSSLSEVGNNSQGLISQIKEEMGKPGKVKVLTSLQEEQLLQHINNPDVFHRRMTTLSILQQLRQFLCDNRRKIRFRVEVVNSLLPLGSHKRYT